MGGMKLIKKGAEANLFLTDWHDKLVVIKKRIAKKYRIPQLDTNLRRFRTIHESQLLHEAKLIGVSTPTVYLVDLKDTSIVMQCVKGSVIKGILDGMKKEAREKLCIRIGRMIGRLHKAGMVHGDLTTSNMILTPEGEVYFIDFGLGNHSKDVEDQGVDIHLMERALQSAHFRVAKESLNAVLKGYAEELGESESKKVMERVREIERRARYIER